MTWLAKGCIPTAGLPSSFASTSSSDLTGNRSITPFPPGLALRLSLRGRVVALDVIAVYGHPQHPHERIGTWIAIAEQL
eukprot:12912874-Prorocentrum_lima.AAC.1